MITRTNEENHKSITLKILEDLFPKDKLENVNFRLWDGSEWPDNSPADVTLILNHPGSLKEMLSSGTELGMGEAYLYDDIDIDGNVETIFNLINLLEETINNIGKKIKIFNLLRSLPSSEKKAELARGRAKLSGKQHSIERDRTAVTYHYDVSNDFYSLWLDPNMVYSCGYFSNPEEELEKAQEKKLNYICKKLRLRPGHRLLDIGCGWGGLVICAAQHHNIEAIGITLSQPQADFANQRIAQLGLSDRCKVLVQDYREVPEDEPFDALVSVGMFEHVGSEMLSDYFQKAYRLLKPYGIFLNHGISTTDINKHLGKDSFSDHYVFPDGELVPIQETIIQAEKAGFETRDVESLREHYVLTLRNWVKRLEENHKNAIKYVDEATYRVWRLYMSGSIHGFKTRRLNIYQSLFVKPDKMGYTNLPLTRMDLYNN